MSSRLADSRPSPASSSGPRPAGSRWLRRTLLAAALPALGCARAATTPSPTPAPQAAVPAPPTSAAELIARMHDRYEGKWYRTMTFLQNNTLYRTGGGEDRSQWMEYMAIPGRLRIEYPPATSRSGVLYENGRVHAFNAGKRLQTQTRIHPLLLMGGDVYAIPPEVTLRRLDSLSVDLAKFRSDTLSGVPVYVVGAAAGDSTSAQVWVEADRLVTLRVVERETRGDRTVVTDSRFAKYQEMDGVLVATERLIIRDGRPVFKEEYADVKLDVPLDSSLFDPEKWNDAKH